MGRLFISHARADKQAVKSLVSALEFLNHETWIDHRLSGGQKWWEQILGNIRNCDIFVVALSKHALRSDACRLEYAYAKGLGKTVLPVMVAGNFSVDDVFAELAAVQFVDYRTPNEQAALALAKALQSLPKSAPLPTPLPDPPVLAPSLAIPEDPQPDAVADFLPAVVSRPLKVVMWTLILVFLIFPAALLASALIIATVQTIFFSDKSPPSPAWTLSLMVVLGGVLWRYLWLRFERLVKWLSSRPWRRVR